MPTSSPGYGRNSRRIYLAFHLGCPHHYLSDESLTSFCHEQETEHPDYVLGKIVYIDEQLATEMNNPYGLALNTTFYQLTVANYFNES